MKALKLFLDQLARGELPTFVIFGVALLVVLGAIYAVSFARALRHEDQQASRRCGYKHRLRQTRPTIVYESQARLPIIRRRVTKAEDPWIAAAQERAS